MQKKFLQITFLGLICLILVFFPGYRIALGSNYPEKSPVDDGHPLATFPALSFKDFKFAVKRVLHGNYQEAQDLFFKQFINRSFQKQFEDASVDQFPFRVPAIQAAKIFEKGMINLAYLFLNDSAIPTDTQSGLFVMRDSPRIIYGVDSFSPAVQGSILKRIKNYADLIHLFPQQKFYLFYIQRLADSPYDPMVNYHKDADAGQAYQYFIDNKPQGLIFGDVLLSGIEDHYNYFYKTDHHWNIEGACHGYHEIYKMLSVGFPAISPVLNCDEFTSVPDVMFLGSLARTTLYPIEAEKFDIANVPLPAYKVIIKGKVTYYDQGVQAITLKMDSNPYRDLYRIYFGNNDALEEYVFDNGTHRNALIIKSSFVNPIKPYLAYHYNHTYFVDFRGYTHFSLRAFLKKYPVDDVIIIGDHNLDFTSASWIINP